MGNIDQVWAEQELSEFLRATSQVPDEYDQDFDGRTIVVSTKTRADDQENQERAQVVEKIFDRVLQDWPKEIKRIYGWDEHRRLASRALAELRRGEEIAQKLGDGAPQMDAGRLHPWVWGSAQTLWQSQHFNAALQQAAISVNAFTQQKVDRRDISESDLFKQVFSASPSKPGQPRLRLMEDDGGDTFRSLHRGAMALAEGLYAGIRNPIGHTVMDEIDEQEALEKLAAFSVLARWVDKAKVVRTEETIDGAA